MLVAESFTGNRLFDDLVSFVDKRRVEQEDIMVIAVVAGEVQVREHLGQCVFPDVAERDEALTGTQRLKKRRRISGDTPDPLPVVSRVEIEIERFEKLPLEETDDPLDYWRENKGSFEILRKIAVDIFSIPALSASSEQAFSAATRVSLICSIQLLLFDE